MTRGGDAINCYNDVGLEAEEYALPWIKMFDRWFYEKEENFIYCSDFISKTGAIVAGEPNDCIGQKVCARHNISVDPDGYVYPVRLFLPILSGTMEISMKSHCGSCWKVRPH